MKDRLSDRMPMYEVFHTSDPRELVQFIEKHSQQILVVSLDHDLNEMDFGGLDLTGMDVVAMLETKEPMFPVLIHSSNTQAVEQMQSRLEETNYTVATVLPFDGVSWIAGEWFHKIRKFINNQAISASKRSLTV
jgi:CheY-like chemotaxis protein